MEVQKQEGCGSLHASPINRVFSRFLLPIGDHRRIRSCRIPCPGCERPWRRKDEIPKRACFFASFGFRLHDTFFGVLKIVGKMHQAFCLGEEELLWRHVRITERPAQVFGPGPAFPNLRMCPVRAGAYNRYSGRNLSKSCPISLFFSILSDIINPFG